MDISQLISNGKINHKLYNYFPAVKKWLRVRGCNHDDALDFYQQALLILCEKSKNKDFKLTSSIETYLFSVCKYLYLNSNRKKKEVGLNETYIENEIGEDVEFNGEKEKRINYAIEALNNLQEKCNKLLKMFYFNKLSMKDIAKQLGYQSEQVAKNEKYKCLNKAKEIAHQLINKQIV